ncbi:hypothetical protein ARTHRO9V_20301 [Arthrobacter sp. 9V]|nr:hypothetical protein ARTHRO9V_20301 [Arthrobacter sp. 9V]
MSGGGSGAQASTTVPPSDNGESIATAPLSGEVHVNVSPRGLPGTFAVLDEHTFAWLDVTGSGSETIAHLRENGRITVVFCAFVGRPNIVRLHGTGRVVSRYDRADYRITKNRTSIDGLAAYDFDAAEPAEPSVQG